MIILDLHGKTAYQARVTLDAALRRATPGDYRIRVIHGYHHGDALRRIVREEYARNPKVLRVAQGESEGQTELVLREY